jgi:type I restriction enzyme S subunit
VNAVVTPPEALRDLTLADVARWSSGGTPKAGTTAYYGGPIPWAVIGDLNDGVVTSTASTITEAGLSNSSAKVVPTGTLLVAMYGSIGKLGIAGIPMATNQAIACAVPNPDVDTQYLFHYLKSQREDLLLAGKGGAQQNISQTVLKAWPIPVPPLDEQRRLAIWLDGIDGHRASIQDRLAAACAIVDRLRGAVLAAACSGRLTAGWRTMHADSEMQRGQVGGPGGAVGLALPELPAWYDVTTVGAVSERIEYGTSKKADVEGDVPVLRMGNIRNGTLDTTDLKFLPRDAEVQRLLLDDGDLLFNRTNSPDLVGKTAVFHGSDPATFASYLIRVRFRRELMEPDFVGMWLNSAWGRAWARHVKTDGVSQSNINGKKLAAMPLPMPAIEEQREIVARATAALHAVDRLEAAVSAANVALDRAMRGALSKAFRKELVTADADLP